VKCDEAKPSCQRCVNTGRKCDGYSQEIIISSAVGKESVAIIQRISTHVPGNSNEKRGFQFFITHTASELSGYYSSSFWESLILQASVLEPSLRHAVIAIGSLHEDFSNKKPQNSLDYRQNTLASGFAINQYTKAIGHLRWSLATGKQAPLTALMSCILFICFDSLRGYFETAMVHLQSGLRILRDLRTRSQDMVHIIENNIAPLFMRLSVQAILYIDTRSCADRKAFAAELMSGRAREERIPESFSTLEEARNCMNRTADGLFRMFYMCDGDLPMGCQTPEAWNLYNKYTTELAKWSLSFEKFMNAKSRNFTSKQVRGAALLKIQHTTATIMAMCTPDANDPRSAAEVVNSETTLSRFVSEFRIIVNLSRSLITAAEQDIKSGKSSHTFSTDLGVIAPLYYTCVKCSIKSLREEAMDLLMKCPRREGMWDSTAEVQMIREFWEIEQRHKDLQKGSGDEIGLGIPLTQVVDLVLSDGMKWEWIWKDPQSSRTPSIDWIEILEDQSLFTSTYTLGNDENGGGSGFLDRQGL
jgi:hypothetical protein